jgi:hypothetical protein
MYRRASSALHDKPSPKLYRVVRVRHVACARKMQRSYTKCGLCLKPFAFCKSTDNSYSPSTVEEDQEMQVAKEQGLRRIARAFASMICKHNNESHDEERVRVTDFCVLAYSVTFNNIYYKDDILHELRGSDAEFDARLLDAILHCPEKTHEDDQLLFMHEFSAALG